MIIPPPVAEYSHSHCYLQVVADLLQVLCALTINCAYRVSALDQLRNTFPNLSFPFLPLLPLVFTGAVLTIRDQSDRRKLLNLIDRLIGDNRTATEMLNVQQGVNQVTWINRSYFPLLSNFRIYGVNPPIYCQGSLNFAAWLSTSVSNLRRPQVLESGARILLSRVLSVRKPRRSVHDLAPLPTDLRFDNQRLNANSADPKYVRCRSSQECIKYCFYS